MHFQYQHNSHRHILGATGMNTTQLVEADVNGAKESYLLALHTLWDVAISMFQKGVVRWPSIESFFC